MSVVVKNGTMDVPAMRATDYAAAISEQLRQYSGQAAPTTGLQEFIDDFWRGVAEDDLVERDLSQDAELTWQAWQAFLSFDPAKPQVEVTSAPDPAPNRSVVKILHPDMPFITDSVLLELSRRNLDLLYLHNVTLSVREDGATETLIYAEVERLSAADTADLLEHLGSILEDVRAVVADHQPMRQRALTLAQKMVDSAVPGSREAGEYLLWLCNDHFTFLGYRSFEFTDERVRQVSGDELGYLRNRRPASERPFAEVRDEALAFLLEPTLLSFSKAGTPSRVHRPAYPDYIGVKHFDDQGQVIGESGFMGLYTSPVYTEQPSRIPLVRDKVANVLQRSGHRPNSFDGKALAQVLATYPRDELFQASEDELFANATAIAHIHERRKTRVFLNRGRYGLFYHCLVYLPRDLLNTRVRMAIQQLLCSRLGAQDVEFESYFSESVLVRLQFILRVDPNAEPDVDLEALQSEIVELSRDWAHDLEKSLNGQASKLLGGDKLEFSPDYQATFDTATAVYDVGHLARLQTAEDINLRFYRADAANEQLVNLKLFKLGPSLSLTRVVPILENLGFHVVSDHPYRVTGAQRNFSIQDFLLRRDEGLNLAEVGESFEQAFTQIWRGVAESDGFNGLVLSQNMPWRDVALLRAFAGYMRQAAFGFERSFIADTLLKHAPAAKLLISHFYALLDPDAPRGDESQPVLDYLDSVPLLNEDRVLRLMLDLMSASMRTNYFQPHSEQDAGLVVFKLAAQRISELPQPRPKFEIFVYSPQTEGVHLRSSDIARGGIRWSDRLEDFRTEVLGLVKAQIVKNAVIVPSGAKGGFVVKEPKGEDWQAQGVASYRRFIGAMLSVTDNLQDGKVVPPPNLVRRDGDDPYFVVAADKGTASFSDIANEIAVDRGFWLADGFASGGSVGYDHKKLGITARGAWVSVQRHFRRLGIDPQNEPISAVAIGDMGGDVFGNGMLRTRTLQLLAAFNHLHIFIDPNPDAASAFDERQRLFDLPRSSWLDYEASLISDGGGIFERTQKSIPISAQMQAAFDIAEDSLAPDDLIRALLCAPVDLLFNGGIGTYVKARGESAADVGDRANDSVRVNGEQVRAKMIGEGGNLGLTHKGRIEFALSGGLVNADFIDNAAGVDCSDHEVNTKILLSAVMDAGALDAADRDSVLLAEADAVADLVLRNNFIQARSLSLASDHSLGRIDEYDRLATRLEKTLGFDRGEADFPTEEQLGDRMRADQSLTSPELSTLFGNAKILLKQQLQDAELHKDPVLNQVARRAFPPALVERFGTQVMEHQLLPQIVVTQLANAVVGYAGITFVNRVMDFAGASAEEVVQAYWVAAEVLGFPERLDWVDQLDAPVTEKRAAMLDLIRCMRRSTRWIVREHRQSLQVSSLLERYQEPVQALLKDPQSLFLNSAEVERFETRLQRLQLDDSSNGDVQNRASLQNRALGFELFSSLLVAEVAARMSLPVEVVGPVYLQLGKALQLDSLTDFLGSVPATNHWRAMERDALLDDIARLQVQLTQTALGAVAGTSVSAATAATSWLDNQQGLIAQWHEIVAEVQREADQDLAGIAMTVRKLVDLASSLH